MVHFDYVEMAEDASKLFAYIYNHGLPYLTGSGPPLNNGPCVCKRPVKGFAHYLGDAFGRSLEVDYLSGNATLLFRKMFDLNYGLRPCMQGVCRSLRALVVEPGLSLIQKGGHCTSVVGHTAGVYYHSIGIYYKGKSPDIAYLFQVLSTVILEETVRNGTGGLMPPGVGLLPPGVRLIPPPVVGLMPPGVPLLPLMPRALGFVRSGFTTTSAPKLIVEGLVIVIAFSLQVKPGLKDHCQEKVSNIMTCVVIKLDTLVDIIVNEYEEIKMIPWWISF